MWLFIACGSLLLAPQPLPRGFYPAARHAGVKLSVAEPPPKPIESSSFPAIFTSIEKSLEAVAGNPQLLLEAVVGIDKGPAKYDRDNILDYFKARPQLMVARAFDFLMAFRRVKAAWDLPESSGVDRGATLRAELAARSHDHVSRERGRNGCVATRTRRCCVDVTVSGEYLWQACTRNRHPVSGAAAGAAAAGRWQHM